MKVKIVVLEVYLTIQCTELLGIFFVNLWYCLLFSDVETEFIADISDQIYVGAAPGDDNQLNAAIFCMMYFDRALNTEQIAAAFDFCKPNGKI